MLTKQEREEIAERFRNYDKAEYVTLYSGMYDGFLGEHVPKETTVKKDRMELASRIIELCDTSNMIELPRDKNGEAIKVGDVLYDHVGAKRVARGYMFYDGKWRLLTSEFANAALNIRFKDLPVDRLTHKNPVTIASLVEQIRDVVGNEDDMPLFAVKKLSRIADQLESLGDSDD